MMNNNIIIIFSILILLLIAIIIYTFIMANKSRKIVKRIEDYSIKYTMNKTTPFFEILYKKIIKLIKKISIILNKSVVLKQYGEKYNNYVSNNKYDGIDLVSIKILISILFVILYLISSLISFNFNLLFSIVLFIVIFFLIDIFYTINYKFIRKQVENDLLSAIIIMNNAFKSGMNITEAVNIVALELDGPIKNEFVKKKNDIKYGLSLETAFDRFYDRVKIEDIKYISSSLSLINKTGGNIVKVFDSIENNFYDKKKIRNELNSLTSSSKFMFKILVFMPIILIILILMLNKEYFLPLINTTIGRLFIFIILSLYILYIIVVNLVMKVKYYE